jgi:cbb3-type cytochrome oxidase cytochrome c subunit
MRHNDTLVRTVLMTLVVAVSLAMTTPNARADGKDCFVESKCTKCHSAPGVKGGKKDLAGVGSRRTEAWMKKFLLKQETIDGKKHKKKFKGSDAELDELVKWLASHK